MTIMITLDRIAAWAAASDAAWASQYEKLRQILTAGKWVG